MDLNWLKDRFVKVREDCSNLDEYDKSQLEMAKKIVATVDFIIRTIELRHELERKAEGVESNENWDKQSG